uniref:DUF4283 domain-containing protein n=1 Tax=Cannabis sativa TaxID=3483 RepID=A0A803QIP5_CANSA
MDSFHPDISKALSVREREVINLTNIAAPPPRPTTHRLICKVFSCKGYNPKQFNNFIITNWKGRFDVTISNYEFDSYMVSFGCKGDLKRVLSKEPWQFHNRHMILCLSSNLQNASMDSYTTIPFWIQVFRGQTVTFPWMFDELWLEYRYERLSNFSNECGIIGHVFDKYSQFLVKLDEGEESDLPYGPWMEGSALPNAGYNRYRQDFSIAGPWPFIMRLARNTITPIISHSRQPPVLPPSITNREKGKRIVESPNHSIDTHCTRDLVLKNSIPQFSIDLLPKEKFISSNSPPTENVNSRNYGADQPKFSSDFGSQLEAMIASSNIVTTNTVTSTEVNPMPPSINVESDSVKDNRMPSLFGKRQLVTSRGNVRNVLKRCCTKATPLVDSTNHNLHQQPNPSSELSNFSLVADGSGASLAQAGVQPRRSP